MKVNIKKLVISIAIPLIGGIIIGFITAKSNDYSNLVRPSFAPPGYVFPIVWPILYILMGISSYIIKENTTYDSLGIYRLQLIVNFLWSIIFFTLNLRTLAFIWILLLIVLVIIMIIKFYKINKTAGFLQIPYLLWLIYAAILNLSIVILN